MRRLIHKLMKQLEDILKEKYYLVWFFFTITSILISIFKFS